MKCRTISLTLDSDEQEYTTWHSQRKRIANYTLCPIEVCLHHASLNKHRAYERCANATNENDTHTKKKVKLLGIICMVLFVYR